MDIKTKEIYSEVFSVLNMLGNNYVKKLPHSLYKMIEDEKLNEYNPYYNETIALEEQNIKKEALSMIALFHLNYWCDSQEEKQELQTLFKENEEQYQNELKEKYSIDNIFENKIQNIEKEESLNKSVAMVEYNGNIFKKLINKIRSIFHIRKNNP